MDQLPSLGQKQPRRQPQKSLSPVRAGSVLGSRPWEWQAEGKRDRK